MKIYLHCVSDIFYSLFKFSLSNIHTYPVMFVAYHTLLHIQYCLQCGPAWNLW